MRLAAVLAQRFNDAVNRLRPREKGVIKVVFDASHDRWRKLKEEGPAYDREKTASVSQVIRTLRKQFPGLEDRFEAVAFVIPDTADRYTGTYLGFQCWSPKKS